MPDRYNHGFSNRRVPDKHIPNTDNEQTQYIPPNADNEDTAEFRTPVYGNQPRPQSQQPRPPQQQSSGAPGFTEGRRQYYGSEGVSERQPGSGQYYQQPRNQGYRNVPPQQRPPQQGSSGYYPRQPQNNGSYNSVRPSQGAPQRPPHNNQPRQPQKAQQRPPQYAQPQQRQQGNSYPPPSQNKRRQNPPPPPPRKASTQPPQPQPKPSKEKKRRKKGIISRIITWLLSIVLVVFVLYSGVSFFLISKLNFQETQHRSHISGALSRSYVTNVLLIGTDGRSTEERGRSDTMILLSINSKTDEITLTSFMRDTYVNIPGHGQNKLNAAYSFGGADLLMDTIEQNFSVRIDNYISVNFMSFAAIIDSIGGIEVDVSDAEAREINTILMAEVNEIMGDAVDSDLLNSGGKLLLSGKQALSYARIRYIGNADFERTERQREVLTLVAEKLKSSFNPSTITNAASKAIPQLTTNMSKTELYLLSLRLPFVIGYDITQLRVPANGTYTAANKDCGSVLEIDFNANYNILMTEVFNEE